MNSKYIAKASLYKAHRKDLYKQQLKKFTEDFYTETENTIKLIFTPPSEYIPPPPVMTESAMRNINDVVLKWEKKLNSNSERLMIEPVD